MTHYCTVRLVNGPTRYEGRVEVYFNGEWGTVCHDYWHISGTQVVCKELGFSGGGAVKHSGIYGQGSGPIWLDNLYCDGTELTIRDCYHWGWGRHNCDHSEDAGVKCHVG